MSSVAHDPAPQGGKGKVIAASLSAAVGAFLFGFDSAVINGAVDAIGDGFHLGSGIKGFTVAIALLGCAVGAWYAGGLADKYGRKPVMLIGAAMFFISSVGSAFSGNVEILMFWRVIGGIGIGIASVISPAYISEISPARMRGALTSLHQLAITVGIFAALLSDTLIANIAGDAAKETWFGMSAWRWMFLVGAVPALAYAALSAVLPESPRYLVKIGQEDKAREVLDQMGESDSATKINEIRQTIKRDNKAGFADIRGSFLGLKPLVWVGIVLAGLQQLVGINAIFYYSTTLWRSVGFSEGDSFKTSVITSVINVGMTFVAILFVDRFGRRLLLLVGSIGMLVGLGMASLAFFHQHGSGDNVTLPGSWGVVALIGANLFVIFFAATWGPVVWVLLGEMFPNRMRAYALAIGAVGNWLCNFLVSVSFPWLTQHVGLGYVYGTYALFALISYFFVRSQVPETTGHELEAMTGETHTA